MAKFNSEDQRNLEQLLEEGWLDRLKARGAEAMGVTKGLGQQIKGGLQQAAGSGLSKVGKVGDAMFDGKGTNQFSKKGEEFTKRGQEDTRSGMASGHNAKIEYLKKNIDKRIASFVADIKNDIQKLGLDIGNIEIVSGINDALNQLKKNMSGKTPPPLPQQSQATPPPLPKQEPEVEDEPETENPTEYSYKKAVSKKKKPQPIANPRKGKVKKDPFAKYAAPEQEEDLDEMFWK